MARIRTIKPEFFRHEALQDLEISNPGKYPLMVFAGLWGHCDSKGRFEWKPRMLKLDILPFLPFDMNETLEILNKSGMVRHYVVDGKEYGVIETFEKHQRLSGKELTEGEKYPEEDKNKQGSVGEIPEKQQGSVGEIPEKQQGSVGEIPESQEGKGRERKGNAPKRETFFPDDFSISEKVRAWAEENGYDQLDLHLANFADACRAKGYKYIDWDAAFRGAISKNWAGLKAKPKQQPATADGKPYRDPMIFGFDVANGDPLPDGWTLPPTGETRYMPGIGWVLSPSKPRPTC